MPNVERDERAVLVRSRAKPQPACLPEHEAQGGPGFALITAENSEATSAENRIHAIRINGRDRANAGLAIAGALDEARDHVRGGSRGGGGGCRRDNVIR